MKAYLSEPVRLYSSSTQPHSLQFQHSQSAVYISGSSFKLKLLPQWELRVLEDILFSWNTQQRINFSAMAEVLNWMGWASLTPDRAALPCPGSLSCMENPVYIPTDV